MTNVAIADLDNTLIRGSYLFHFGAWLVRRRMLSPRTLLPFVSAEYRYVRDRAETSGMPQRISRAVLGLVRDREQAELASLCEDFVHTSIDQFVVPEVLQPLGELQELGIPVYVATASPQELAEAVARRLQFAGGLGTIAEVVGGRYTGRLASPLAHGAEKLRRVEALMLQLGADPSHSWAFSDSANDLPLLTSVGWPVAVNADARLRSVASSRGWLSIESKHGSDASWATRWGTASVRWLRHDPAQYVPMH